MRKRFLNTLVLIFMFFIAPLCVKANFGDLRYEITDINISNSKITFKGWAFIHRTNNFNTINYKDGTKKTDGGQKVLMQAVAPNGSVIATKTVDGTDEVNYNFYCELFEKSGVVCNSANYNNKSMNSCKNYSNGVGNENSKCYYEDIYFKLTFDVSGWSYDDIRFKIAVSNNDFESKSGYSNKYGYDNDYYTVPEYIYVSESAVSNTNNNYIEIVDESLSNTVEYIAARGILHSVRNSSDNFYYPGIASQVVAAWDEDIIASRCDNIYVLNNSFENDGRSNYAFSEQQYKSFLGDYKGTHYYAIKIKSTGTSGYDAPIACPHTDENNYKTALAHGSHIKLTGNSYFKIKVKNQNYCDLDAPDLEHLYCNNSGTLTSVCESLTVDTRLGRVAVKIEQEGTISNVLTPDTIHAGGGFKFGVMYYNTIKWNYVNGKPSDALHNEVVKEMNKKLKGYEEEFVPGLKIVQLKFGDEVFDSSFLEKKCFTSDSSGNYYDNELVTSCVFSLPGSTLYPDGRVDYVGSSNNVNINNKFYTPLDYNGKFVISASITGMDRITSVAALKDSKVNGKGWTGDWSDTFEGCDIQLYPLLYKDGKYNFVYRPIDINNPFPSRNPGINWYNWIAIQDNIERLKNTYYGDSEYTAVINNSTMNEIKKYNEKYNYLDWNNIETDSFIDNYDYVKRGGS